MRGGFDGLLDDLELGQRVRTSHPALAERLGQDGPGSQATDNGAPMFDAGEHARRAQAAARSQADLTKAMSLLDAHARTFTSPAPTREQRIEHARSTVTIVLAKAMVGFERGEITGEQVRVLEARGARILEQVEA